VYWDIVLFPTTSNFFGREKAENSMKTELLIPPAGTIMANDWSDEVVFIKSWIYVIMTMARTAS
jgi:hypothetical protein